MDRNNQVCQDPRGVGVWGGGGGGTLILSYIRRLGPFFGVKILNFNICLGFQKNKYFLGMKILWIFFGGHHQIRLYLGVISMHFRVFSLGHGTEWGIFFDIFLGCLKFLIFFWGEG